MQIKRPNNPDSNGQEIGNCKLKHPFVVAALGAAKRDSRKCLGEKHCRTFGAEAGRHGLAGSFASIGTAFHCLVSMFSRTSSRSPSKFIDRVDLFRQKAYSAGYVVFL